MDEEIDDGIELEIREYSDADFYPDICPLKKKSRRTHIPISVHPKSLP